MIKSGSKSSYAHPKTGGGFPFPCEDIKLPIKDCYLGNYLIKKGHTKVNLSMEQLIEHVKCSRDPIYFAKNYCRIVSVDDGIIPFRLFGFQEDMLRQYHENRFSLTVTARQMGKTTTVAAFILWYAIFHPAKECAILANKGAQAQEVMSRIRMMIEYLPFYMQPGIDVYNKTKVIFDNGSTMFSASTSSSSIRGHSVALLYIDEAAFIQRDMEFYESTYPVISSGEKSRVIMTSTPKGKRGMFYKLYQESKDAINSYVNMTVTWKHHPKRNQKWKEETIRNTSAAQFAQEFDCSFIGSTGTLIESEILERLVFQNAINDDETNHLSVLEKYNPSRRYVAVADPAGGVGQDYSVCTIFDVTALPYKVVAKYRNSYISPLMFPHTIVSMTNEYGQCPVLVEANNDVGGQVSYILYYELEYENVVMTAKDNKGRGANASPAKGASPGVRTDKRVKAIGCSNLKSMLENDLLIVNDFDCITELGTFIQVGSSYQADKECHDDCVMTLVLFSWFVKQDFFEEYANSNISASIYQRHMEEMMSDLAPFGFKDNVVSNTPEEQPAIKTTTTGSMAAFFCG